MSFLLESVVKNSFPHDFYMALSIFCQNVIYGYFSLDIHIFFSEYLKFIGFILGKQDVTVKYTRTVEFFHRKWCPAVKQQVIKYMCLKDANVVKYTVLKVKCKNIHNKEDKTKKNIKVTYRPYSIQPQTVSCGGHNL